MGDSQAMRYRWLGTWHAYRNRGRDTLDTIQPWVRNALLAVPIAKYLGLSTGWSVGIGVAIIVAAESVMLLLGRFDIKGGVLAEQTRINTAQDPWRVEVLDILRRHDRPRRVA